MILAGMELSHRRLFESKKGTMFAYLKNTVIGGLEFGDIFRLFVGNINRL